MQNHFKDYFKFCFVRNPWDRFCSLYSYARMGESMYHSVRNPEKALTGRKHKDYDLLKNATLKKCAHFLIEGKLSEDKHWLPQSTWILDAENKILVDYMGRVENIDNDFREITGRLKIKAVLGRENASQPQRGPYQKEYDPETRGIVGEFYKKDVELFGYKF